MFSLKKKIKPEGMFLRLCLKELMSRKSTGYTVKTEQKERQQNRMTDGERNGSCLYNPIYRIARKKYFQLLITKNTNKN